ncbi:hydroxymethylglutaryl-CoA lyase [Streptomyces sp. NPDC020965]|uniref:hydroxymethylglutaryl-CoA lyase n=1 Tax=Streptomyces sp. NPDC020965 TaxID=3365105 RepID=UPI00379C86A1
MIDGLPMPFPEPGLPTRVRIHEVGPRDGLQNEKTVVPTEVKAEFVHRLAAAGLTTVEATSFVHPDWVPQLADAERLLPLLAGIDGVDLPVLVPNEHGLERALTLGARRIAVFGSATETFARKNLNRTVDESLAMFAPVVARAKDDGVHVRGYLSMCFGDPWEGPVPVDQVARVARRLYDLGCDELSLGDTIGVATPGQVLAVLTGLTGAGVPVGALGVHFHDTYGQALANTLTALRFGVTTVDASAGGLGGCPYAKSATGNLATEDLVWMLQGLGVETGVDLGRLVATSVWMADRLGRPSPSRTVRALSPTALAPGGDAPEPTDPTDPDHADGTDHADRAPHADHKE